MSDAPAAGQTIALGTLLAPTEPWQPGTAGEVDCYDMASFERAEPRVRPASAVPDQACCVRPGDVLVSRHARAPRRAWVVVESRGRPQVASSEWLVLRSDALDPGYARQVFVSNEFELICRRFALRRRGRAPKEAALADVTIVLPAKYAQLRVARVMDQADALRRQRAVVVEHGRRLAQALFAEQFGAWEQTAHPPVPLSSLLRESPCHGADVALAAQGRFPVIRASDLHDGKVSLSDARYVSHSDAALARAALADGDVLLARASGRAEVHVAIARPRAAVWFTHAKLWRLRADTAQVWPEYLRTWLVSPPGQRSLTQAWTRGGSRVPVEQRLAGIFVPLPPIEDQRRFAERLNAAEQLVARLLASAARLDALLGTLRDLAFRGELILG